jgi:hopanoid-associated phosphorylase
MIGYVVALPLEARALPGWTSREKGDDGLCRLSPTAICAVCGPGRTAAAAAAHELHRHGATCLAGIGVSGGLAPNLYPGELVLANWIHHEHDAWSTAAHWTARLSALLTGHLVGPLACVDEPVLTAADKRELHEATGALAVDMESAGLADAAHDLGLPFVVLRAVLDESDADVPGPLARSLGPHGSVDGLRLTRELLRRPWLIGGMIGLGVRQRRAVAALRAVANLITQASVADCAMVSGES